MMTTIESYLSKGRRTVKRLASDSRVRLGAKLAGLFSGGLLLSAAGLAQVCQPITLGLVLALRGWQAALFTAGGWSGYLLFWGEAGRQGILWLGLGLLTVLGLGWSKLLDPPAMKPAVAGLIVSASGLAFQLWMGDLTPVPVYLLRVAVGAVTAWLFPHVFAGQGQVSRWLGQGIGVLALAQVAPFGFSLGYIAAGALAAGDALPAAALAGLALDLSQVTPTPMTAVLCLAYLTRLIPRGPKWLAYAAPGAVYLLVMGLRGEVDTAPVLGLALGGGLAALLPPRPELTHRRGETGLAQVRLEIMSQVLSQTQQLLLEVPPAPVDEEALVCRARERACGSCPNRRACQDRFQHIPTQLLHRPLLEVASLGIPCRKPARMIQELRRSQEQLRSIRADRDRQKEYRAAVIQQYRFLSEFLQQLADQLPRRRESTRQNFRPEISMVTAGRESANGDRCFWFPGTQCRYYVLLCDGMGTGLGAAQEGQQAGNMLRQMLSAGFPAEYALESLNSLCCLREKAASVTVDLAEIHLDTGRTVLYKWGAAPSVYLRNFAAEKIGTAGPPPGLAVAQTRQTTQRLSLGREEVLMLLSDGVDPEAVLSRMGDITDQSPGELAARAMELGCQAAEDDATVVVVRLRNSLATS